MFVGHGVDRSNRAKTEFLFPLSQEQRMEKRAAGKPRRVRIPAGVFHLRCFDFPMQSYLIMTVLGSDRPGLVSSLADTVARHGGNWLESRMARLAGQFAGIVRIECPSGNVDALLNELSIPGIPGLTIQAARESVEVPATRRTLIVDVVGNDRPGIVRELSTAIANAGGNVEELTTGLESAPMSGHPMFRAHGVISIPENSEPSVLTTAIESLGGDLTVDVSA
jgi:glycine cleavage system regulatory protein